MPTQNAVPQPMPIAQPTPEKIRTVASEMADANKGTLMGQLYDEYTKFLEHADTPAEKAHVYATHPFGASFQKMDESPDPFIAGEEEVAALESQIDRSSQAEVFSEPGNFSRFITKSVAPTSTTDLISYLREKNPGHTFIAIGGEVFSKPIGSEDKFRPMDPGLIDSLSSGSPLEIVREMGRDVGDVAIDAPLTLAKQSLGIAAGGAAGVLNPALAPLGYSAGMAAGGGLENALKQYLGKAVGVNKSYDPSQMLTSAAIEGGTGLLFGGVPGQALLNTGKGGASNATASLRNIVLPRVGSDLEGSLSKGQLANFRNEVKKRLRITDTQYDLMSHPEIAKMMEDRMQGIVPQLQSRLIKPLYLGGASGLTGVPTGNLKAYVESSSAVRNTLQDEDIKGMFLKRMKSLAKSISTSGQKHTSKMYAKAIKDMEKEGASGEDIFNTVQALYQDRVKSSLNNPTGSAMVPMEDAETLQKIAQNILGLSFQKAPRTALNADRFLHKSGQIMSRDEARKAGAFTATPGSFAALKKKLSEIGGPGRLNTGSAKPPASEALIADTKQIINAVNENTPEALVEANKIAGSMFDVERGAKKILGKKASETSPLQVGTFLSRAPMPLAVENQALKGLAEVAKSTGKQADVEAYQALVAGIEKQKAYNAVSGRIGGGAPKARGFREQFLPAVSGLYQAVKGVGDLTDYAGRYGAAPGLNSIINPPMSGTQDPEKLDFLRKLMNITTGAGQ